MGIINRSRVVTVGIPIPRVKWVRNYETTRTAVSIVAWSTLGFIIVAVISGALLVKLVEKIDKPGPKVITKVVYRDALSAAQQNFINTCKADVKSVTDSSAMNSGVPNVETNPWTCTFPN